MRGNLSEFKQQIIDHGCDNQNFDRVFAPNKELLDLQVLLDHLLSCFYKGLLSFVQFSQDHS